MSGHEDVDATVLILVFDGLDILSLDEARLQVTLRDGRFDGVIGQDGRAAIAWFDDGADGARLALKTAETLARSFARRGTRCTLALYKAVVTVEGDALATASRADIENLVRALLRGNFPKNEPLLIGHDTVAATGCSAEALDGPLLKGRAAPRTVFRVAEDASAQMLDIAVDGFNRGLPPVPPTVRIVGAPDQGGETQRAVLNSVYGSALDAMMSRKPVASRDPVTCTVFAPPEVAPGDALLVQVFAHLPAAGVEASALAREFDEAAGRRVVHSLQTPVPRETVLTFELALRGARVLEPAASLRWRGDTESVQFPVEIPQDARPGALLGRVTVSRESVPIGRLHFKLTVGSRTIAEPEPVGDDARRFSTAFVSYATADRARVLARVQMLAPVGIKYFQDVLDLEPGARWEQELYRHIDASDLFLLFWSRAASESEWVLREARYAVERQGPDGLGPPAIVPVLLETPPAAPPPELAHLHFGDRVAYLIC